MANVHELKEGEQIEVKVAVTTEATVVRGGSRPRPSPLSAITTDHTDHDGSHRGAEALRDFWAHAGSH